MFVCACFESHREQQKLLDPSDSAEAAKNGKLQPALSFSLLRMPPTQLLSRTLSTSISPGSRVQEVNSTGVRAAKCFKGEEGIDEECLKQRGEGKRGRGEGMCKRGAPPELDGAH